MHLEGTPLLSACNLSAQVIACFMFHWMHPNFLPCIRIFQTAFLRTRACHRNDILLHLIVYLQKKKNYVAMVGNFGNCLWWAVSICFPLESFAPLQSTLKTQLVAAPILLTNTVWKEADRTNLDLFPKRRKLAIFV